MTAVHQVVASFAPRDATGNHTLQVQSVLHELGYESEIFVAVARPEVRRLTRAFQDHPGGGWLLYQLSTGSSVADWLSARPEPKIVNYHNITPASFFAPWEPHVGVELDAGRRQLRELAPLSSLAIADSGYNQEELTEVGYDPTTVVPILLDTATFEHGVDEAHLERLRAQSAGGAAWLFVGRLAPNKCQHDLMKAFAVYRQVFDPDARLRLVGGSSSGAYHDALLELASAIGIERSVDFVGDVPDAVHGAHFRAADVYVSLSEHEGFGVPLLEAMHHRLPIVAYGAAAVPETIGAGGLCLEAKDPATVATAVHRVLVDHALRDGLVAAGTARLGDFDLATSRRRFADAVRSVVG
ncbi:MAG TPA: glycosyltransferase family 4 protein [Acidimicrobiales bacterium]